MCAQYISDKNFTLVQETAAANLAAWKVLTVENGQVQDLAIAFDTCAGLFPFNELTRR